MRFEPEGFEAQVAPGTTLHAAAAEAGVRLEAPCGGLGRCGSCRVRVTGDVGAPRATEQEALSGADAAAGIRLACLARAEGPGPVTVERIGVLAGEGLQVAAAVPVAASAAASVAGGRSGWGVAVDVGTTTLAAAGYDLGSGASLGTAAAFNPQIRFGHDVLTRVSRALAGDADELREVLARAIEQTALRAGGESRGAPSEVMVVGNPTMLHLLLGLDVSALAAAPYEGALTERLDLDAADAGLPAFGDARVRVGPAVSAFVGADVVAGLLATGLAASEYPALFIDLGTNGEMVLATRTVLLAASAAGGPALEGVSIEHGMRAEPGAVERVRWRGGELEIGVVRDIDPVGICGTGLLDLAAVLLDAGALDVSGRLQASGPLASRVEETPDGMRFRLTETVYLTQRDVRQLQLAKGAVATAVGILVETAGLSPDAVREVVIAGGFGTHVNPASLAAIGMVPAAWADRITFAGNTALGGASAMLLDPALIDAASALAAKVRTVDLAGREYFQSRFIASLDFPSAG
ncbi:MAG TPA: ASKHA domain-containing protein [Coriobacteriia bacterium]